MKKVPHLLMWRACGQNNEKKRYPEFRVRERPGDKKKVPLLLMWGAWGQNNEKKGNLNSLCEGPGDKKKVPQLLMWEAWEKKKVP